MNSKAEETLALIAINSDLAESVEGVRSILLNMYRFPNLKNKILSQKTGIAVPTLAATRSELVKAGIIEKRNRLGEIGRKWVKKNLYLHFDYDPLQSDSLNEYLSIPKEFAFLKNFEDYIKNRPIPKFDLDQAHANFETLIKRTLYLLKQGDLEGRKLIFLGDDDVVSLLVGLTGLAEEIMVLDIDQRILDFLMEAKKEFSLKNFNTICHDLRDPCPPAITNKYDVVIMDPPYTDPALRLFLKRAKEVLTTSIKINNEEIVLTGKKLLLCFGNKPPKESLEIQASILDHGFEIKEIIPNFNRYIGASIIGQFSHVYYLELAQIIDEPRLFNSLQNPIYTSEVKGNEYRQFRPIGIQYIGELRFSDQSVLLDNEKILKSFLDALNLAKLTITDVYHHQYTPYGYSAIAILKTSHAVIHTWPEHGYLSLDIFICDEFEKGKKALQELKQTFNPISSEFFVIERGKKEPIRLNSLEI